MLTIRGYVLNNKGKVGLGLIIGLVLVGVFFVTMGAIALAFIGTMNTNAELTNQFKAKQLDNTVVYDNFWKTLKQKAGVVELGADKQTEFFDKIMAARYEDKDNVLVNMITEQNPTFDMSLFKDLSLSIEALRKEFTNHQSMLIDIKRELHSAPELVYNK